MVTIAIVGSASVGKTTLAADLAERLGVAKTIHVDGLVPHVESDLGPSFITRDPNVWKRRPEPWVTSRPWHSLLDRSLAALRL